MQLNFIPNIKNPIIDQIPNLNYTSCQLYHSIKQLPLHKSFNIYMDNYLFNINLFKFLRDHNYGACGTVRTNSSRFTYTKITYCRKIMKIYIIFIVEKDISAMKISVDDINSCIRRGPHAISSNLFNFVYQLIL